jgi:lipopolysaccharide/colanic/teichoic acid biosynthesis glycosyltransferase
MHDAMHRQPHLVILVTAASTRIFFGGQIKRLREAGFHVTFVSGPGPEAAFMQAEGAQVIAIPMEREISLLKDAISLCLLWRTFRRIRPDLVNVGTPKAGLLGGIAARLAGVPRRIYTMHGLRYETASGFLRTVLAITERIACTCAQHVRCVSSSLRRKVVSRGFVRAEKAYVLGKGSSNGIDVERFRRTREREAQAREVRRKLGIPDSAPVIGFVGRFTRDKGINELYRAYVRLKQSFPELRLLMLGEFEDGDPVDPEVRCGLENDKDTILTGAVSDTPPYFVAMDVLALPTYREGFPNVPLEAQAAGVPVITTTATGAVDSVADGITGRLIPPGDETALVTGLAELLSSPTLRQTMGKAATEWVRDHFSRETFWNELVQDYRRILQQPARSRAQSGPRGLLKGLFDRVAAAILLTLLSPVLGAIALLVKIKLGSPVFFRQKRPGKRGRPFELIKFRTMTTGRDTTGTLLSDAERLTPFGLLLRSLSLDELPQLWNVLRGELSFVGPRPLLVEYLERYTPEQARRHEVKPGITGWAQVKGRNAITWAQKFALDTWYVDHWSLWLDFRIILRTVKQVIVRHGISPEGQPTMEEFMGEERENLTAGHRG